VENVLAFSAPYKFLSKEFRQGENADPRDGTASVAATICSYSAGPCSVSSEGTVLSIGRRCRESGPPNCCVAASFKAATSPYYFQGMEEARIKSAQKAKGNLFWDRDRVMSDRGRRLLRTRDLLHNRRTHMQKFVLLKARGKCGRPFC